MTQLTIEVPEKMLDRLHGIVENWRSMLPGCDLDEERMLLILIEQEHTRCEQAKEAAGRAIWERTTDFLTEYEIVWPGGPHERLFHDSEREAVLLAATKHGRDVESASVRIVRPPRRRDAASADD